MQRKLIYPESYRLITCAALVLSSASALFGEPTLSLASGSVLKGSTVSLPLSYVSGGAQVAGVMWTFAFSPNDVTAVNITTGSAATAAAKTITCNSVTGMITCLAVGAPTPMNASVIPDGTIGTANFTISGATSSTSSSIQLLATNMSDPTGNPVTSAGAGGVITIELPTPPPPVGGVLLNGLSCNPLTVISPGDSASQCTVTLSGAAPAGGISVTLGSIAKSTNAYIQSSLTVPQGATSASFYVYTTGLTVSGSSIQISAAASTGGAVTTTLGSATPAPPPAGGVLLNGLTCTSLTVISPGDSASQCTVTLSGPAPAGGILVTLSNIATLAPAYMQSNLTVPQGATSASFYVYTTGLNVSGSSIQISAAASTGGAVTTTLGSAPAPPPVGGVVLNSLSCTSLTALSPNDSASQCIVTLSGSAPAGGILVTLSNIATLAPAFMQNTLTVPQGSTTASFYVYTILGSKLGSIQVSATANSVTQTFSIQVP